MGKQLDLFLNKDEQEKLKGDKKHRDFRKKVYERQKKLERLSGKKIKNLGK